MASLPNAFRPAERPSAKAIITTLTEGHHLPPDTRDHIVSLADEYQFLHPHIAFPDIHQAGGFDAVVGNPPWEQIQYDPRETFAVSHPHIASARTMAVRNKMIALLADGEPDVYARHLRRVRHLAGVKHFLHASGRYPLGSVGRLNTAPLFVELMWGSVTPKGRIGVIVPTGIATDSFTRAFFAAMVDHKALVSLYDFENRRKLFPIDSRYRFCLLTLTGADRPADIARFVSFAHDVADVDDPDRRYTLTPGDLALFNPNTRTAPLFRKRRDAEITTNIYRRTPVLVREGDPNGNPWDVKFQLMYMMNSDSHLFRTRSHLEDDGWVLQGNHFVREDDRYLPLYVLAMVHQYDHRWATFENGKFRLVTDAEKQDPTFVALPQYWVPAGETDRRIGDDRPYLLGWRDVARSTDTRTFIMSPHPRAGVGNKLPQFVIPSESLKDTATLTAAMNSFACDFITRQKLGGTTMNFFYVKQFAVLPPDMLSRHRPFIEPRIVELCYTAWDMADLAASFGWNGSPFRWKSSRRAMIRAEIDALMFRLYGLGRSDVDYILGTFDALRESEESRWGYYRTKQLILERYDTMIEADHCGQPYQTILDPPPGHPSQAGLPLNRP